MTLWFMDVCRWSDHFHMLGLRRLSLVWIFAVDRDNLGFLQKISSWRSFYNWFLSNYQEFGVALSLAL